MIFCWSDVDNDDDDDDDDDGDDDDNDGEDNDDKDKYNDYDGEWLWDNDSCAKYDVHHFFDYVCDLFSTNLQKKMKSKAYLQKWQEYTAIFLPTVCFFGYFVLFPEKAQTG